MTLTATEFMHSKLEALRTNQKCHYAECQRFQSLNTLMGTTIVILSTLTLGFTFGGMDFFGKYGPFVVGGMSIVVGILAGIQTFANHAGRAIEYQSAAISYGALLREFELRTSGIYSEEENTKELSVLMERWTEISKTAPLTKLRVRKAFGDK